MGVLICATSIQAKPLKQAVGEYQLECDETFACPESLLPRVSFWIEVFSRWDTRTAVFHDKDKPQRVYSTIDRKQGCRHSRKGDAVDRERKRLKKELKAVAAKVSNGKALTKSQHQLESLFIGSPVSEIRIAADRVRCQSGNQDRMEQALKRFQVYRPTILDALESRNLTSELQYLPFVESAFDPQALSHVGAAGLWQIMPSTGRKLGLVVNSAVDERYDPRRATYAAAKYLRDSVDDLSASALEKGHAVSSKELIPFAITSYNYGVRGMQRAIRQVGLNYERLLVEYKSPNFQTAVKNFYASFLAARHVAKNAEQFFGPLKADQQEQIYSYSTVKLPRATSAKRIVEHLSIGEDLLKKLNPALKKVVWRDQALIPQSYQLKLPFQEIGWSQELVKLEKLPAEYEKPGFLWHRVKKGQTACGIAEKYRASCRGLIRMNRLNKRGTIYAGKRIKVPTKTGGIGVNADSTGTTSRWAINGASINQRYRVRAGDTACQIAARNRMKCTEFLALNGLNRKSIIKVGQKVVVTPTGGWHTVSRGQTPCGIADRYRIACSALLNANQLVRTSTIYVGQRLRIPSRG